MKKQVKENPGMEREDSVVTVPVGKTKARVIAGTRVTVSLDYQSVQTNFGYEEDCSRGAAKKVAKKAWNFVEEQIVPRIHDAQQTAVQLADWHRKNSSR